MNTPNTITLVRLLMIPVIVFFYLATFIPYARLVAVILFVLACTTDFLDGYLARKYNQVTTLGKFFDTIADKVLIMAGLILIVAVPVADGGTVVYPNVIGVICAIVILAREFIVSALRQLAAAKGVVLAADMGGKVKANVQYIIVTAYMALAFVETDLLQTTTKNTALAIVRIVFMAVLIGAAVLTVYSGAEYLIKNRHVFKDTQKEALQVEATAVEENIESDEQQVSEVAVEDKKEDKEENN